LFKAQFRAAAPRARHVPPSGITPVVTPSFQFGGLTRILQRDVVPAKRIPQARVRRNNNTPRDIQRSNLRENANSLSLSLSNVFRIEREVTRAPFAIFRAFRFHRDAARRTFIVHAAENHVAPPHARYTHTHTHIHTCGACVRAIIFPEGPACSHSRSTASRWSSAPPPLDTRYKISRASRIPRRDFRRHVQKPARPGEARTDGGGASRFLSHRSVPFRSVRFAGLKGEPS